MRIAISATGPNLDAEVDSRFGRCPYFIIVDPDTMQFEALDNSDAMAAGGAGISTSQVIANKGAQVVLTGNLGPNAYQVLSAAGIQVITGATGKIRDAIQAYKSGKFQVNSKPSVADHFGLGVGGGGGRGKGRGTGRGMRAGIMPMVAPPPQPATLEMELEVMKDQAQMLAQQLTELQSHIEEMETRRQEGEQGGDRQSY